MYTTEPDAPALIEADGDAVSYGELYDRGQRVAAVLHDAGLRRGDGVVLVLPNRREFLEIAWGCQLSGLYYSAVNTHFTRTRWPMSSATPKPRPCSSTRRWPRWAGTSAGPMV